MKVSEETDGAAIGAYRHQNVNRFWLRDTLGFHRIAGFVEGLEETAVERDVVFVLAGENSVGLGAGGYQDRSGGQGDIAFEAQGFGCAEGIDQNFFGREVLGEADTFLKGFGDFFVVERVAGRVDEAAANRRWLRRPIH